jgi:hypothetical protein
MSPTLEGFRAASRRPSLTFAEIAWRWTVGAFALALIVFAFVEYLVTLPITDADAVLLGTRHPLLVGKAISHILRGSLNRALLSALLAAFALAVLWILAASLGRAATVRALLNYFGRLIAEQESAEMRGSNRLGFRAMIALNFFRVALTVATILSLAGAVILASFVSPDKNPRPGLAFLLFLPCAALICALWSTLNWLLSLASIFTIRDGSSALSATSAAVQFSRDRAAPILAVSTWTGLAHLVAISIAGTAFSIPLAFVQVLPGRVVIVLLALFALAYFAIVDWLYIARLAGYVSIMELPATLSAFKPLNIPQVPAQEISPHNAIDRDEPILSDLPNLVVET